MWAPPTSADQTTSGLAAWMRWIAGAKLVTSSGKNSVPASDPPFSVTIFCIHLAVIWP